MLGTGEPLRVAAIEFLEPGRDIGQWRTIGGYRKFEQLDPEEQAAVLAKKSYKTAFLRVNPKGELAYSAVERDYAIPLLPAMSEEDPETLNSIFFATKTKEWVGEDLIRAGLAAGWTAASIDRGTALILAKTAAAQTGETPEFDFSEVVRQELEVTQNSNS